MYVNTYGAVAPDPVNVINGEVASSQTSVLPVIVAVGNEFTVMFKLSVWALIDPSDANTNLLKTCAPEAKLLIL